MAMVLPMVQNPSKENVKDNIIELTLVNGKLSKKEEIRYNKDGSIDKRKSHKVAGVSSEVFAFNTKEEIASMIKVLDNHIINAPDENKRQIACRNKMLFLVGINIGIRASDLCGLKWSFFLDNDGRFKDVYSFQPKKTKKTGKFVKIYFNDAVKKAIADYIVEYPIENMDDYLFKSRKGNNSITEKSLCRIIKDTASEANIDKNIGSHSLRKTFGFWTWHNAKDKDKSLVTLQMLFNHSSTQTTLKYIGLLDSEIEDMFNSIDLGMEFL